QRAEIHLRPPRSVGSLAVGLSLAPIGVVGHRSWSGIAGREAIEKSRDNCSRGGIRNYVATTPCRPATGEAAPRQFLRPVPPVLSGGDQASPTLHNDNSAPA